MFLNTLKGSDTEAEFAQIYLEIQADVSSRIHIYFITFVITLNLTLQHSQYQDIEIKDSELLDRVRFQASVGL